MQVHGAMTPLFYPALEPHAIPQARPCSRATLQPYCPISRSMSRSKPSRSIRLRACSKTIRRCLPRDRSGRHTISDAGHIGDGSYPRPGEVNLSHHGILFLDELPEFNKNVLENSRQPGLV
jgi:magnesium chelatase family protein